MMLKPFKQKTKKCKFCGNKFSFINTLAKVCSIECAVKYSRDNKVKERVSRELNKIARDKIKPRSEHLKEAQTVFKVITIKLSTL